MKTDADLVQIVDAALADATARSGGHLACRPGCFQCCVGVFAINGLDAERLVRGAVALSLRDRGRYLRLIHRVKESTARTAADFPGDIVNGLLDTSPDGASRFEDFANDEVCPVLDPDTGTCDLYEYRPLTCRVFGPPVRTDALEQGSEDAEQASSFGICELCFVHASPEEIAKGELIPDPENLEGLLLAGLVESGGMAGSTTVSYALSTRIVEK